MGSMEDYDRICDIGHIDFLEDKPYRQYTDRFAAWAYGLGREEAIWIIVARQSGPKLGS